MFESGVYTKNRTYRKPFTSTVRASLAGNPGTLPFPEKKLNLGLAEMQFPDVMRGLLILFSLFLVDILSRPQFLLHLAHPASLFLRKFGQIFSKSGEVRTLHTLPWHHQWSGATDHLRCTLESLPTATYDERTLSAERAKARLTPSRKCIVMWDSHLPGM